MPLGANTDKPGSSSRDGHHQRRCCVAAAAFAPPNPAFPARPSRPPPLALGLVCPRSVLLWPPVTRPLPSAPPPPTPRHPLHPRSRHRSSRMDSLRPGPRRPRQSLDHRGCRRRVVGSRRGPLLHLAFNLTYHTHLVPRRCTRPGGGERRRRDSIPPSFSRPPSGAGFRPTQFLYFRSESEEA